MLGEMRRSVEEVFNECNAFKEELEEVLNEADEGSCRYEEASRKLQYIEDAWWSLKSALDTLEEGEKSV